MSKNKNLTIKILALFISILLWSYVRGDDNPNIIREFRGVNVEIKNERLLNEAGLVVIEPEEIKISVKISGRKSDVNSVTKEEIKAQVDLAEEKKGSRQVLIEVQAPYKVEIVDRSETYASFEIDSVVTVEREVEIDIEGDNKDGIVKESVVTPKSVKISGPSIYMDNIARVVSSIDVGNISASGIMKLPVKLLDKNGNEIEGLKVNPGKVEVSFLVLNSKEVPIEASLLGNLKEGYEMSSFSINPTTVTIKGLPEDIENVEKILTQDIDITDINKDENINVALKLPEGVEVNQEKVTVNIKLKSNNVESEDTTETEEPEDTTDTNDNITKEILVPIGEVELRNIDEDLLSNFDVSDLDNIGISIEGNKDIIESLDSNDMKLALDLDGLEEGINEVKIIMSDITGVVIKNINPESIKIKLEAKN